MKEDPEFVQRAKDWEGGFIVAGENYGQGSSREHAAMAPWPSGSAASWPRVRPHPPAQPDRPGPAPAGHRQGGPRPARGRRRAGRRRPPGSRGGRGGAGRGAGRGRERLHRRPRRLAARARGRPGRRGPQPAPEAGGGGGRMSADVFGHGGGPAGRAHGDHGHHGQDRGRPAVRAREPGPVRVRRVAGGRHDRLQRPGPPGGPGRGRAAGGGGAVGHPRLHQLRGRAGRGRGRGVPGGLRRPAAAGRRGRRLADALAAIGGVVGLPPCEPPGSPGFKEATRDLGPNDAVVFVDHDDLALVPALIGCSAAGPAMSG